VPWNLSSARSAPVPQGVLTAVVRKPTANSNNSQASANSVNSGVNNNNNNNSQKCGLTSFSLESSPIISKLLGTWWAWGLA
jgi:hypothetical protein